MATGSSLGCPTEGPPSVNSFARAPGDGYFSCAQLALLYGVPAEALRKRLERWQRLAGHDDAWVEVENPRRNQPRILYRLSAVRLFILSWQALQTGLSSDAVAA